VQPPGLGWARWPDNPVMRPSPHRPNRPSHPQRPRPPEAPAGAPLGDAEIDELDGLLAGLPAPLEPLDASALDGYLCGVLLQPRPVASADWLRFVGDVQGRPPPEGLAARRIAALAMRRHAELDRAIGARAWFDPWVFELEAAEGDDVPTPAQLAEPWVAGFSLALECFPALAGQQDPALVEPMAVLYAMIDPEDLEDAGVLAAVIETLEPPATLDEAVEDLVRSVLLIADVSRPRGTPSPRRARRPG
jgi:uncharacterized protein